MHGCNCAFWKADFVQVNGYNNQIQGWGHEDIELAARLINAGLLQKKVKLMAICYHMYHPVASRSNVDRNYGFYEEVVKSGSRYCINGYQENELPQLI